MSEQSVANRNVFRRCVEDVWNRGDLDILGEVIHPSFLRHHERNQDEDVHGPEGFRRWVVQTRQAFPDIEIAVEKLIAEQDRVMAHLHARGTHEGELKGVAASGIEIEWTVTAVIRFADGRIVECWAIADTLGILQRLGQIPAVG